MCVRKPAVQAMLKLPDLSLMLKALQMAWSCMFCQQGMMLHSERDSHYTASVG